MLSDGVECRTKKRQYVFDDITACCVVLRRLSSTSTCDDMKPVFGMRYSALSKVFWEAVERFVDAKGHLVTTLKEGLLQSGAARYASAIEQCGAPLDSCIGFIYCTKIKMNRLGGHGSNQRACYSGHKRMYCLVYQTITTPDGLIFSLYGPQVGRRHDLTLLRNSGVVSRVRGRETSMVQGRDARLVATDCKRSQRSGAGSDSRREKGTPPTLREGLGTPRNSKRRRC